MKQLLIIFFCMISFAAKAQYNVESLKYEIFTLDKNIEPHFLKEMNYFFQLKYDGTTFSLLIQFKKSTVQELFDRIETATFDGIDYIKASNKKGKLIVVLRSDEGLLIYTSDILFRVNNSDIVE